MSDLVRKKGEMLQALRECHGIVWKACQTAGITRYQHDDWMKDDEDYKSTYASIKEDRLDYIESKMLECIEGVAVQKGFTEKGDPIIYEIPPSEKLIQFALKTQGKSRGYVERQEVTGAEGERVVIQIAGNL